MRKTKLVLAALVAVLAVGFAFAVKSEVPATDDVGYLYNPATGKCITSSAVMGDAGVEFIVKDRKDCGSSFGSDDGKIEEAGYTYVRFMLNGTGNYMRLTNNGVVCTASGYHKWAVKAEENGLIIRCIYTSTQGNASLNPFAQQGFYLTPAEDGSLELVASPTDASYWEFLTAEELEDALEAKANEENAAASLPNLIKTCKTLVGKPMNASVKAALEAAITAASNYTGSAMDAYGALNKAYEDAQMSAVAYKGVLASYESHKSFLEGNELAEYEARVADIMAKVENGTLEGDGIAEMAKIAVASYEAKGAKELSVVEVGTEIEVNQDYQPGADHGISIDWEAIATTLGTEETNLKLYAVLPDGTLDENYGVGSAGTDGWRDAQGNWASWNSADNLFYVQFKDTDPLALTGIGCMRTAQPIKYVAAFKVVPADKVDGSWVTLNVYLNVKEKEIDLTVPANVSELTVAQTLKQKIALPVGASYGAAANVDANLDAILAALGETSLENVKIFAIQADGALDVSYGLGSSDGWRDAEGSWAQWGSETSQFYVKSDFAREAGQLYEIGCHPDHSGAHLTGKVKYTAAFAFVVGGKTENKSVIYDVILSVGDELAPVAPTPKATDLDVTGATPQYFYNVEGKGFLIGANNWNTRASIDGTKGYLMHFEANGDTYKLCATNNTGTNHKANDLDCSASDQIWVDGAGRAGSGLWTFNVNEDGTFTISNTNVPGYLSITSGDASRLFMSEADDAKSTWIAVSEEDYAAMAEDLATYNEELAYYNEGLAINEMKKLMESTNVYTADAYEAYKAIYEEALAKHENNEVVVVDNPSRVHDWHATNSYDDFLLSAWTIGGAQATEFATSLYINTWSVEADGKANGSEMHVPFFEYWIADDNSLAENNIEGTVTGLSNGNYIVEALVRVRMKNGAVDPAYGITLSANGGQPFDVCNGATCDDGAQFRYGTFSVPAKVTDGTLKINFNIAADNNISWLSFKNVKYSFAMTPVQGDVTAIEEVANNKTTNEVYNLSGQKVNGLQKGINIVGGKKVYVR